MGEAPDASPKAGYVEIQQKPGRRTREFQIRHHLRQINRVHSLDGFYFDHNPTIDVKVEPQVGPNQPASILELHGLVPFDGNALST